MAGGRRHYKRPPYQPAAVQPLVPGANRFQPSEAYLARVGQQTNLTPATSPAFWPQTLSTAPAGQAAYLTQPSAAARWVEEQERVHETSGFAPPPSVVRSASGDVEQPSQHAHGSSEVTPVPSAPRPSPPPEPEPTRGIDDEVYDELYGELYGVAAGEPPTEPPARPSSSSSSHSTELYPGDQASLPLDSPLQPSTEVTHPSQPPPVDYIPLLPTSDHDSDSDSEEELIQEQLVRGFGSAQDAEEEEMDSEDELYGKSRPEEITIHDDDSEIDHEEHHSERDSSPEQPFDFGADSDQHDDEVEDSFLLEGDSLATEQAIPAPQAQHETAEPSPKRRRLSADDSIEVLELSDSEEEGVVDQPMPSADAATLAPLQGSTSTLGGATAPRGFGGLSRVFTFGSQARESPLAPVTSTDTASAQPAGGVLRRAFTARRQRSPEPTQLQSSRARTVSSTRPRTTTAPRLQGAAASLVASDSHRLSQASPAAEATSDTAALGARGSVQYNDVDMVFSGAPFGPLAATSSTATAPVSIQPITIPRARERAIYQRRVDLSSTPVGTPDVVEAQVRDDRGKITYRPSPLQPAPIHQSARPLAPTSTVTGKGAYVRAGEQPSAQLDSAPFTSNNHRPQAAKGSDAVKVAYGRASKGRADPNHLGPKVPGQLPLSAEEKAQNLPTKYRDAFPSEFSDDTHSSSSHLYTPATLATAAAKALPPPDKDALFGFWPAPPPLVSGKGLWPPPRPLPGVIAPEDDKRPPVHIFIDNSNVLYAFLNWVRARPEARLMSYLGINDGRPKTTKAVTLAGKKVKLDYATLFAILERGRKVEKRVLVASSALWQSLELAIDWGYEISLLQRVPRPVVDATSTSNTQSKGATGKRKASGKNKANGGGRGGPPQPGQPGFGQNGAPQVEEKQPKAYKEQAVDELIHMKILESLLDYTPTPDAPRPLLVVVSGDAKSSEYNPTGFLGPVRRALDRGWDVEIMSFASGTSSSWTMEEKRAGGEESGGVVTRGKLRIVDLEKFAEELVL